MTIVSFNTFGYPFMNNSLKSRYIKASNVLNHLGADVILLQEVFTYIHLFIFKKHLRNYKHVAFKRTVIGPKGGLVIFSKLPLYNIKYITFKKDGLPLGLSIVESVLNKGILTSAIKGHSLFIINTHFYAVYDKNWSKEGKFSKTIEKEIGSLGNLLKRLPSKNTVIIGGDFNIKKGCYYYRMLLDKTLLTDVFSFIDEPTCLDNCKPYNEMLCIDYILLRGSLNLVREKKYLFRSKNKRIESVSDHKGLMVKLNIINDK